ncbi:MAG: DEAD/DEAH box helicase [Chloroflexi bacterium]|nr:DEAD/DEAH box helicase [Chloroflexota bacterium]
MLYEPREWQHRALGEWRANDSKGIVQVVTGGGKTVFAEMCMLDFIATFPSGRIVIVVPTLTLLDQWYVSLREELGVSDGEMASYSGESQPSEPKRVNLMVLNTARKEAARVSDGVPSMLIVDECHRAGSSENARALQGQHQATLGMSATPERDYDDGLEANLVPGLGPIVYEYDYNEAAVDGVVAPFDLINVAIDLLPDEEREYRRLSQRVAAALQSMDTGGLQDKRVKRLLQLRARVSSRAAMRVPAAVAVALRHRGEKVLLFHEQIEAAEQLNSLLDDRGVPSTLYHSRIGQAVRRDNLRLFRRGRFDALVSCRALDEGTNIPETSVAIIASSTASGRQRIQRMGRVLRPAKGKALARIYTIYATKQEEERLAREARALVGASSIVWRRIRIDD